MERFAIFVVGVIFFAVSSPVDTYSQDEKKEVEKSISRDKMPSSSLALLNKFWKDHEKADFYHELNNDVISYEAKVTWRGYRYSIEFYEDGSLMDIEQLISFDEIPEASQNTITTEIEQQFPKFRFTRIQRQFYDFPETGKIGRILNGNFSGLTFRYEIEIDGESKEKLGSFELTFDKNGKLIQQRRIVRRSLDNIW